MIEVEAADLAGPALAWAVGMADGRELRIMPSEYGTGPRVFEVVGLSMVRFRPDVDWVTGGPLLDAHCKGFGCVQSRDGTWRAFGYGNGAAFDPDRTMCLASGPSILVAGCRAILIAKRGDRVIIPKELLA